MTVCYRRDLGFRKPDKGDSTAVCGREEFSFRPIAEF